MINDWQSFRIHPALGCVYMTQFWAKNVTIYAFWLSIYMKRAFWEHEKANFWKWHYYSFCINYNIWKIVRSYMCILHVQSIWMRIYTNEAFLYQVQVHTIPFVCFSTICLQCFRDRTLYLHFFSKNHTLSYESHHTNSYQIVISENHYIFSWIHINSYSITQPLFYYTFRRAQHLWYPFISILSTHIRSYSKTTMILKYLKISFICWCSTNFLKYITNWSGSDFHKSVSVWKCLWDTEVTCFWNL